MEFTGSWKIEKGKLSNITLVIIDGDTVIEFRPNRKELMTLRDMVNSIAEEERQ